MRSFHTFLGIASRRNSVAVTLAVINMNNKKNGEPMKFNIPLFAILVLAALPLVGCNRNSPSNSTEEPSPNSSMSGASGMMNATNMPATNTMHNAMNMPMNTNMATSTNQ
jgi:hypothetical protein